MSGLNSFTGRGMLDWQYQEIWTKAMMSALKIKGISNDMRKDLVSDVVCKIYTKGLPEELVYGTNKYWGYISVMVKHAFIDITRVKKRGLGYKCEWDERSAAVKDSQNLKEEEEQTQYWLRIELVEEGMKVLKDVDKELIEKKYLLGWSYEQIAEHFGYSNANCASTYVKRAKDRLTKMVTQLKEKK